MKLLSRIVFLTLTAIVLNTVVYFGFVGNYTRFLFSEITYRSQYQDNVYKYRVIGKEMVLKTYHVLKQNNPDKEKLPDNSPLKALDPAGSENFYLAYFMVNTFMLILCGVVLCFIFDNALIYCSDKEKYLIPFTIISIISLSEFVVVPYDITAYFFLLISGLLLMKYFQKNKISWLLFAGIWVLAATLNRETSALSISLIATVLFLKYGVSKRSIIPAIILFMFWIIPYIGLRLYFGFDKGFIGFNFLEHNLRNVFSWIGIIAWIVFGWLSIIICNDRRNKIAVGLFHLLCLPYVISCFVGGILFEIRLYIPVFISAVLLAKIDPNFLLKTKPKFQ
jgi:hypothetical protein